MLGWRLYSLMGIISAVREAACPFPLQRQGKGTGTQILVVSVHISTSLYKSTFSGSVISDAGRCIATVESWAMFPAGDCALGEVPPPGVQQVGQGSHMLNIFFIQSHQREPCTSWYLELASSCSNVRMGPESYCINAARVQF